MLRLVMETLLSVENLSVRFRRDGRVMAPVRDVSFTIAPGEYAAVVGESGCGKSMTSLTLTRLSPTDRAEIGGHIIFEGRELTGLAPEEMRRVRGRGGIAYIFQDPAGSLNPVMRIGDQIAECLTGPRCERLAEAEQLLERVGLPDPARAVRAYPCMFSGGMQQRAMVALALACKPRLLIADEPTTALDVTTQRQVLDLIDRLAKETGMAVLLITHNLGLVAGRARNMHVMYAGQIVESGPVEAILKTPQHPYTVGLLAAVPRLDGPRGQTLQDIPGTVPSPDRWPEGCAFEPRCNRRMPQCLTPPSVTQTGARCNRCWLARTEFRR